MEIFPSEYQSLELVKQEKIFVHNVMANEEYGYLLLKINPTMAKNASMDVLINSRGVIFLKFFNKVQDSCTFTTMMEMYVDALYSYDYHILKERLLGNKSISENGEKLKFPVNIVHVFPNLKREDVDKLCIDNIREFIEKQCLFSEELSKTRKDLSKIVNFYLDNPIIPLAENSMQITDLNVNSIIQRIAPEYVTVRVASNEEGETTPGVNNELVVVDKDDVVVRAFRLDKEQINIVNKISKEDPNQLILACAGSGKSVILISKCFKAAQMNPDKKFLITCKNENLHSLYTWFIDRAGLREKNVECLTFHSLCKRLLQNNGFFAPLGQYDRWVSDTINAFNNGNIKERYYGIFIDEVQAFETDWYKLCFNLLQNKNTKDHIFVICGDKTQRVEKLKKHGQAPWQAGEGYPSYRGGNKNIRIEKNYRNCIEINEYINRFAINAKQYLYEIQNNYNMDPDMFLRGKSVFHGKGVQLIKLPVKKAKFEIDNIILSIRKIHDDDGIPYDEIAVIMYNGNYRGYIRGWADKKYYLEYFLCKRLEEEDIPFSKLYSTNDGTQDRIYDAEGVRLVKFQSTLGLDFRAAIVCGMIPLGEHDKTKNPDWKSLKDDKESYDAAVEDTLSNIQTLYVACTRAREILHIIIPESEKYSVYMKMLKESI